MRSLLGVLNICGLLLAWFAALFAFPIITALLYGEFAPLRCFVIGAIVAVAGGLLVRVATMHFRYDLKSRDAYLLVTVSWLGVAAVATTPLMLYLPGLSVTKSYFETMSGLSTTGAIVL